MMSEKPNQSIQNIHFTAREWDVLSCLSTGRVTSKDIARCLHSSPKTIETHISHILTKTQCHSRHHITAFIRDSGVQRELQDFYSEQFGAGIERYSSLISPIKTYYSIHKTRFGIIFLVLFFCGGIFVLFRAYQPPIATYEIAKITTTPLLTRVSLIKLLDKSLKQPNAPVVALVGQGGSGKTTLARAYIREHPSPIVFEINAENHSTLLTSFIELAEHLAQSLDQTEALKDLNSVGADDSRAERLIRFVYQNIDVAPSWLLLFDNVDDIALCRPFLPSSSSKGRVILTTRDQNVEQCPFVTSVINIGELTPEESLKLFTSLLDTLNSPASPVYDHVKIQEFLKQIPPYPLDISLAAHYIRSAHLDFDQYIERMVTHQLTFHQHENNLWKQVSDYPQTRYAILTLSIKKLIEAHADYQKLLWVLAHVHWHDIPVDLLKYVVDPALVDAFIHDLRRFSLITSESEGLESYSLSIHCSTQDILKHYLTTQYGKDSTQNIHEALVECANKTIQENQVMTIHKLLPHFEKVKTLSMPPSLKDLFQRMYGSLLYHATHYNEAKEILESCLIHERNKQNSDPEVLFKLCVDLGCTYKSIMETENAKEILEEGLKLCQRYFAPDSGKRMIVLSHLSHIYRRLGHYKKTEEICGQCLDMDEKSDHQNNATRINLLEALCDACREQGMFGRAESYVSQISVCLKDFKYCPLKHAHNINLLAHIRYDQGLYQEAIALYEQSLAIYEKNLPPENNRIIKICLKLSSLYRRTGNVIKAQELLSRTSSKNLIVMAMSAYEHAHLAVHHNHYQEALDWGWKSHDLYTQIYGKQHIKTMRSLCLVGYIEFLNGQLDKAEKHLKQALENLESQQSYLMHQSLYYLSILYRQKAHQATGEQAPIFLEQSNNYQQKAIDIAQKYFPSDSAHIVNLNKMQ